jgi:hypothetical protein
MRESLLPRIWVSGRRWNVDYLFDTATGLVVTRLKLPSPGGRTAGIGHWCGRSFVAVYVDFEGEVFVQVDERRMPVDGTTAALHDERFSGLMSALTIVRPAFQDMTARAWLIGSEVKRRLARGDGELDRSCDDFLADVADIVNSRERRDRLAEVKDPEAGPWLALS